MIGRFIFGHWRCKMERTKRLIGVVYLFVMYERFDSCCVWKVLFGKVNIVWKGCHRLILFGHCGVYLGIVSVNKKIKK